LVAIIVGGLLWYGNHRQQEALRKRQTRIFWLGQLIVKEHNCPEAITEASAYVLEDSGSVEIWKMLGACQFDMGKFADAKVSFDHALAIDSTNVGVQTYLKRLEDRQKEIAGS